MHSYSFISLLWSSSSVSCARPSSLYNDSGLQYTFTKVKRTTLFKIMVCAALCPFGGFVVPLMCCPAGLLGSFLCSAPVGASRCLPGSVALLSVLGWALLVLSCCSPFLWLLSLSFIDFPPPAVCPVWCPGPVLFLFAGTSLWVSGCSCDGLVALLSCWECGCALSSFRQMSHGSKG